MNDRRITYLLASDHLTAQALATIRELPRDGSWQVVVAPYRRNRSLAQNRLYWLWLKVIADHVFETTGQQVSDEDMHEWFKARFLGTRIVEVNGEAVRAAKSTRTLSVAEFSQYLERIDHFAAEHLGLTLPHPQDMYPEAMGRAA